MIKTCAPFLISILFASFAWAQSVVVVEPVKDLAAVYSKADFDSKIIYLLPKGKKVIATRSTKEGVNGLGLFHKVKLNSKTFGYMLDTEVKILKSETVENLSKKKVKNSTTTNGSSALLKDYSKPEGVFLDNDNDNDSGSDSDSDEVSEKSLSDFTNQTTDQSNNQKKNKILAANAKKKSELAKAEGLKKKSSKSKDDEAKKETSMYFGPRINSIGQKQKTKSSGPLIFSNLIGGQLGVVNYAENVGGGKKKSSEWLLGFKMTGPNLLFRNLLTELSVSFHFGAPKFFDDFSTDSSGFFIITDLTFPFILSRSKSTFIYAGIGPMLNASFFDFNLAGEDQSTKNLRLGGVATLGIIYDVGDWALKLEPKYYFESSSYWGVLAGIQKRF